LRRRATARAAKAEKRALKAETKAQTLAQRVLGRADKAAPAGPGGSSTAA